MDTNNTIRVSEHFDANWQLYLQSVNNNTLYHKEMFSTLNTVLDEYFRSISFSLADLGCGDASAIAECLADKLISRYIGVDAAPHLIIKAPTTLAHIDCKKEFMCEDMSTAIQHIMQPLNIIVCSYALHHLSYNNKVDFIKKCQYKLSDNGIFVLIDGVLAKNQNRDEWITALGNRFFQVNPNVSKEEGASFLEHPRIDDFPESIETFRHIAEVQKWRDFQVLIDKEIFAFMVFIK